MGTTRRLGLWGLISGLATLLALTEAPRQVRNLFGPAIEKFEPNRERVTLGDTVVVTWKVADSAAEVLLDDKLVSPEGNEQFKPTANRTFKLVARSRWWRRLEDQRFFTVYVEPPRIEAWLGASVPEVKPGEPLTITWRTKNAQNVLIEPLQLVGTVGPEGTKAVLLSETTIFTLTATSTGVDPQTRSCTVTVLKTILEFAAEQTEIHKGETVKLHWQTNATSVEISPGIGTLSGSAGERYVSPQETTNYEASADGPSGLLRKAVTVTVLPPRLPSVRASIDQPKIVLGASVTIRWQSQYADRVILRGLSQEHQLPPSGVTSVQPDQKGRMLLTLVAEGPGGQENAELPLEVLPPPPPKLVILPTPPAHSSDRAVSDAVTQAVLAHFTGNSYDVLPAPRGISTLQQFSERYDSLLSRGTLPQQPDYVIQAFVEPIERQQETTGTQTREAVRGVLGEILKKSPVGGSRQLVRPVRYIELISSCTVTIRVLRLPDRKYVSDSRSAPAQESKTIQQGPSWRALQAELSRRAAERAVTDALSRFELKR